MQLESTFKALRDGLYRYYDTPFALRSGELEKDRRALLDQDGVSWREPFVEPIRDWRSAAGSIAEALAHAGAPDASSRSWSAAASWKASHRSISTSAKCSSQQWMADPPS